MHGPYPFSNSDGPCGEISLGTWETCSLEGPEPEWNYTIYFDPSSNFQARCLDKNFNIDAVRALDYLFGDKFSHKGVALRAHLRLCKSCRDVVEAVKIGMRTGLVD